MNEESKAYPKIRLLENRVLLELLDEEFETKSGLILLNRSHAEEQILARVLVTGEYCDEELYPGDLVYLRKDSGANIVIEGEKYFVTRDINILVVNHPRAKDPREAIKLLEELVRTSDESEKDSKMTDLAFTLKMASITFKAKQFLES